MNRNLKLATALTSSGLLVTLVYKLREVPDGMILSGLFLGGMVITMILVGSLLLTGLAKLVSKNLPFWIVYFTVTSLAFVAFHYQLYSPTLKIVVPENYTGQVSLVKSNLNENILTVDSNGIGYLTEWTFNHSYLKPTVVDANGKNLGEQLVGFNNSSFFGLGTATISESRTEIKVKSFDVVPQGKLNDDSYYYIDLSKLVDKEKVE